MNRELLSWTHPIITIVKRPCNFKQEKENWCFQAQGPIITIIFQCSDLWLPISSDNIQMPFYSFRDSLENHFEHLCKYWQFVFDGNDRNIVLFKSENIESVCTDFIKEMNIADTHLCLWWNVHWRGSLSTAGQVQTVLATGRNLGSKVQNQLYLAGPLSLFKT